MDDGAQINWIGKSGETYRYEIYSMDWDPAPGQDGPVSNSIVWLLVRKTTESPCPTSRT